MNFEIQNCTLLCQIKDDVNPKTNFEIGDFDTEVEERNPEIQDGQIVLVLFHHLAATTCFVSTTAIILLSSFEQWISEFVLCYYQRQPSFIPLIRTVPSPFTFSILFVASQLVYSIDKWLNTLYRYSYLSRWWRLAPSISNKR